MYKLILTIVALSAAPEQVPSANTIILGEYQQEWQCRQAGKRARRDYSIRAPRNVQVMYSCIAIDGLKY